VFINKVTNKFEKGDCPINEAQHTSGRLKSPPWLPTLYAEVEFQRVVVLIVGHEMHLSLVYEYSSIQ